MNMEKENIYAGMGTSEFSHRGVDIVVNQEGMFFFKIDGFRYEKPSLKEAKETINKLYERYYGISDTSVDNLLNKLNDKERKFIYDLLVRLSYKQRHEATDPFIDFQWTLPELDTEVIKYKGNDIYRDWIFYEVRLKDKEGNYDELSFMSLEKAKEFLDDNGYSLED